MIRSLTDLEIRSAQLESLERIEQTNPNMTLQCALRMVRVETKCLIERGVRAELPTIPET